MLQLLVHIHNLVDKLVDVFLFVIVAEVVENLKNLDLEVGLRNSAHWKITCLFEMVGLKFGVILRDSSLDIENDFV